MASQQVKAPIDWSKLTSLSAVREKLLDALIILFLVLGLPAVVTASMEAVEQLHPGTILTYAVVYLPVLLSAVFRNRMPYRLRAVILLTCLFILAGSNLLIYGFSGAGIEILITVCLLTTLFISWKTGLLVLLLSLTQLAVTGYLLVSGRVELRPNVLNTSTTSISWITAGATLVVLAGISIASASFIQAFLQRSLQDTKNYQKSLEESEAKYRRLLGQQIAVNQLALSLGEIDSTEEIYPILYRRILDLVDLDAFAVSLYDPHLSLIKAGFVMSDGQEVDVNKLPPLPLAPEGSGNQSTVIRTGRVLYTPDYQQAVKRSRVEYQVDGEGEVWEQEPEPEEPVIQSALFIPLKAKGSTIGVMQLQSYLPDAYSEEDTNLLTSLANVAAVAIQNSQLLEETQRRVVQLKGLREIDITISGASNLSIMLNTVLEQVIKVQDADAAVVYTFDDRQNRLEYKANLGLPEVSKLPVSLRLGESLAGQIALNLEPLFIQDLDEDLPKHELEAAGYLEHFQTYYGIPLISKGKLNGVMELYIKQSRVFSPDWVDFMETLAGQTAIAIDNAKMVSDLDFSNVELKMGVEKILTSWVERLERAGIESKGHSQRVMELTARVAKQLGVDNQDMVHLMRGAKLHDLGLLGLPGGMYWPADPDSYLNDQHYLSHPKEAYDLLKSISYLDRALETILYHHEHWDGTGFPEGRKGEEIPLSARIVAAVEVYDTLTEGFKDRKPWSIKKAADYIDQQAGSKFDPRIAEILLKIIK